MNNKLGLVLSGGGTKGVAHAGVLKFLEEKGIQPDILAGASVGAIVSCLYAVGKSPKEILDFFKSVYFFNWKHIAFNKPGIVKSAVFKIYLKPIFGEMKIGDLKKEVNITATDIVTGELKIFDKETRVIDAIIASSSFPGIATPYMFGGVLYSDSGILNNFPADIIRDRCDKIIGVYLSLPQEVKQNQMNSIKSVTYRAFDLLSNRVESYKFSYCDWLIDSPKLSNYSTFETKKSKMDEIFQIGYEEARDSYDSSFNLA